MTLDKFKSSKQCPSYQDFALDFCDICGVCGINRILNIAGYSVGLGILNLYICVCLIFFVRLLCQNKIMI